MMREETSDRDARMYAWIIAIITILLYFGTYSCVNPSAL